MVHMAMPTPRRALAAIALFSCMMGAPSGASAQECVAPPGTAAVDEYCETVPTARGDRGGSPRPSRDLPGRTTRSLEHSGADGETLLKLLQPQPSAGSPKKAGGIASTPLSPATEGSAPDQPGSDPLGLVASAVEGGAIAGGALPWALLGSTTLLLGLALLRRRA
jgi:hypothetical protein